MNAQLHIPRPSPPCSTQSHGQLWPRHGQGIRRSNCAVSTSNDVEWPEGIYKDNIRATSLSDQMTRRYLQRQYTGRPPYLTKWPEGIYKDNIPGDLLIWPNDQKVSTKTIYRATSLSDQMTRRYLQRQYTGRPPYLTKWLEGIYKDNIPGDLLIWPNDQKVSTKTIYRATSLSDQMTRRYLQRQYTGRPQYLTKWPEGHLLVQNKWPSGHLVRYWGRPVYCSILTQRHYTRPRFRDPFLDNGLDIPL